MSLYEHDGAYSISMTGQELMHSKASASETLLGKLGVERIAGAPSRILIGGLGLGFTLRSVLESVGLSAAIEMVELIPEVVEWNKSYLATLNGEFLDDPRLRMRIEDVTQVILSADKGTFDAIILDIDNGPVPMVASGNKSLYSQSGINAIKLALKKGGRAVFWSASQDNKFENLLKRSGFTVRVARAKVHESAKRPAYFIYIADI